MRAIWYDRQGAADEVLVCGELPTPEAGPSLKTVGSLLTFTTPAEIDEFKPSCMWRHAPLGQ
jgi:NADPH2:quinone reductase